MNLRSPLGAWGTHVVLISAVLIAQARPSAAARGQQQPSFHSVALAVRVDVLVTSLLNGAPVRGLGASDFELHDNGVIQQIETFDASAASINVVLALDASASVAGAPMRDLQAAGHLLLAGLAPIDRAALTTFSHSVTPRIPLTSDLAIVKAALGAIVPMGETAVLDGTYAALMATQTDAGRSLVLVFTDGRDTASWLEPNEVLETANRSNAVIYIIASGAAHRWTTLKNLADATGGHMIDIESSNQIATEFQKILQEFRSRYLLTFTPRGVTSGGLHRLEVRVRRSQMKVTARSSYIGSEGK